MNKGGKQNNVVRETQAASKTTKYNYGDYLTWSDDNRYELIDGVVYNMTPAPYRRHQKIAVDLVRQFSSYLVDKECEVYTAPFDVRLPEGDEDNEDILNVIQPDLAVICDLDKLDKRGCRGAPELIIEITSPSTGSKDRKIKRNLYEKFGVKEYWIVDYNEKVVEVYIINEDGTYSKSKVYTEIEKIPVSVLDNLQIDLKMVFIE